MNEFQGTAVIVVLFALRCVAPILLMMTIAYGMKRLVRHWEHQEAAMARLTGPQPAQSKPAPSQAAITLAMAAEQTVKSAIPCWMLNNCDEQTRRNCPAFASPSLACWVARLRAEGQIPAKCAGCALYTGVPAFAGGD